MATKKKAVKKSAPKKTVKKVDAIELSKRNWGALKKRVEEVETKLALQEQHLTELQNKVTEMETKMRTSGVGA